MCVQDAHIENIQRQNSDLLEVYVATRKHVSEVNGHISKLTSEVGIYSGPIQSCICMLDEV